MKSDSNVPQKSLFKLAWKVKELETLADNIRQLVVDIKILVERVKDHSYSLVANNVAGYLCSLCGRLTEAVKLITCKAPADRGNSHLRVYDKFRDQKS